MPRGKVKMLYYMAYGETVMRRSLDREVETLRLEGQIKLKDYKLTFSRQGGLPNIEEASGGHVWGLAFLIEEDHIAELDAYEQGGQRMLLKGMIEGVEEDMVVYKYAPSSAAQKTGFKVFERTARIVSYRITASVAAGRAFRG